MSGSSPLARRATVVAAILLPVLGASLLALGVFEFGLLRRWPAARRWLGLQAA